MARQPQGGIVTGGGIDPYVASRMAQDKQAQGNRVLESMRQAGATARQSMGQRSQMQMQTEQLAAQSAETDKVLAARERGSREDRKFQEGLAKQEHIFESKQSELDRDFQQAMAEDNFDRQLELQKRDIELSAIMESVRQSGADRRAKLSLGMMQHMAEKDLARERAITVVDSQEEGFEKEKAAYTQLQRSSQESTAVGISAALAKYGDDNPWVGLEGLTRALKENGIPPEIVSPLRSDPKQFRNTVEEAMKRGILTEQDIYSIHASFAGGIEAVNAMRDGAEGDKRNYWQKQSSHLTSLRRQFEALEFSKDPKVKSLMIGGLNIPRSSTLGGRTSRLRAAMREEGALMDTTAIIDRLTQSMEVPSPHPIPDGASQFTTEILNILNAAMGIRGE